ncbi:hypothetical protein N9043_00325 [bacterium]|nr:hypothetical protein [bacterium]
MLSVAVLSMLVTGCNKDKHYDYVKPIESLYYHELGEYSYSTLKDGELKFYDLPRDRRSNNRGYTLKIIAVAKGLKKPYVKCKYSYKSGYISGYCSVYVRGVNDIGTAGWTNGKFGSGTTTRVQ